MDARSGKINVDKTDIVKIKKSVSRIEIAVLGDEDAGVEGLVKRVQKNETQLKVVQKIIWSIGGVITFLSTVFIIYKTIVG